MAMENVELVQAVEELHNKPTTFHTYNSPMHRKQEALIQETLQLCPHRECQ